MWSHGAAIGEEVAFMGSRQAGTIGGHDYVAVAGG